MRFSDLARKTRAVTLDLGDGDTITGHYRHGLITPRLVHDILALDTGRMRSAPPDETAAALDAVAGHVARLIADWDLREDDDRAPYPLTVDRLRDLPLPVLIALIMACVEDMNAGEKAAPETTSAPSGAGSPPMARSARRRNGTR